MFLIKSSAKIIILFLFFISCSCKSQVAITSGTYGELKLAYNPASKKVTGYYESYSGNDQSTDKPLFSCIFYLEGEFKSKECDIKTYFPLDKDIINGKLMLLHDSEISIKLEKEHGGCWNVQHFADSPANFKLDIKKEWIEIRYVINDKANFYSDKSKASMTNKYVVKGDILYLNKVEGEWAYCIFQGENKTEGWINLSDLNPL